MYDHLEARLHDTFWAVEGVSAELPLIESFLQQFPGTALELGCGSGRLLLSLIQNGYLIEGLDNSEDMLNLCRQQAEDCEPVLHHASMEDFQTGSTYGAITIPAFTLQLLPPDSIPDLLTNIHQHLHPEGGLYITTFIPWAEITGELEEGEWFLDQEAKLPGDKDGHIARCHTRYTIKRLLQQLTREHRYEIVSPDNKVMEESTSTHKLTWYWPRELSALLSQAGFSIEQTICGFDSASDFDDDGQILTIIARADADTEL